MSGQNLSSGSNVTSNSDVNQPMDLAQKSHANRISEGSTFKGPAALVQFGNTQFITTSSSSLTSKLNARNESSSMFSRQSNQKAMNLTNPSSLPSSNISVSARSVAQSASVSPHLTSGFHIPRGAAVVANMTASRSQNISSIIKTTSQALSNTSGRANIISQRMVPISNSGWSSKNTSTTTVLSTRASTPQICGRATITPSRSMQSTTVSYQSGSLRTGTVVSCTIRPHIPPVRVGSNAEVLRSHAPKGIQITHPASHTQKFVNNSGASTVRGVGSASYISGSVGNSVYTPSSTLVTSLASSGTTITPHPGNRNNPLNAVGSTQSTAVGGICLSPSTGGTILTHHPPSSNRSHSIEQVSLKTPIVRSSHPLSHNIKGGTNALPAGTHISFAGSKVIAQSAPGTPLALAQLSNVTVSKTHGAILTSQSTGLNSVPFQSRLGSSITSPLGRGSTSTISMTKVLPHVKGTIGLASSNSGSPVSISHSLSATSLESQSPHASVLVQRASHAADRTVVTHYSIQTPYYIESTSQPTLPVNASIIPSNQYITSGNVSAGVLRISGNGSNSTSAASSTDGTGHSNLAVPLLKTNSSPRPSILRKRTDNESNIPLKSVKNLSAALNIPPQTSPPSPTRPDSRGNGNVSSGSTTISANSSPGMQINEDDLSSSSNSKQSRQDNSFDDVSPAVSNQPCVINLPLTPRPGNSNVVTFIEAAVATSVVEGGDAASGGLGGNSPYSVGGQMLDGMSPRKKPRKQTLMGNEMLESRAGDELYEQPVIKKIKKEVSPQRKKGVASTISDEEKDVGSKNEFRTFIPSTPPSKPTKERRLPPEAETPSPDQPVIRKPHMSLIGSYRQQWKPRHNHFVKHSDVRAKEEKKRTVNEIANEKLAMQRVNGWKVVHLSGQVEDLVSVESDINTRLQKLLNTIEKRQHYRKPYKDFEKDINRLSELFKANMQRSVIIKDQMAEAKSQMSKIFTHKDNIINILLKYGNKRTLRKKEKL